MWAVLELSISYPVRQVRGLYLEGKLSTPLLAVWSNQTNTFRIDSCCLARTRQSENQRKQK